jgi:hypothetical protein
MQSKRVKKELQKQVIFLKINKNETIFMCHLNNTLINVVNNSYRVNKYHLEQYNNAFTNLKYPLKLIVVNSKDIVNDCKKSSVLLFNNKIFKTSYIINNFKFNIFTLFGYLYLITKIKT